MGWLRARRLNAEPAVLPPVAPDALGALERLGAALALLEEHAGWRPGPEVGLDEAGEDHAAFASRKLARLGYLHDGEALAPGVDALRAECGLGPGALDGPAWSALCQLSGVEPLRDPTGWRERRQGALLRALRARVQELGGRRGALRFSDAQPGWDEVLGVLRERLHTPGLPEDELVQVALDPEVALSRLRGARRGDEGLMFSVDGRGLGVAEEHAELVAALLAEDQASDGWEPAEPTPDSTQAGALEHPWGGLMLRFDAVESPAEADSARKHTHAPETPVEEGEVDALLESLLAEEGRAAGLLKGAVDRMLEQGSDFLFGALDRTRRWLGRQHAAVGGGLGLVELVRRAVRGTDVGVRGATLRHLGRWLVRRGAAAAAALRAAGEALGDRLRGRWLGGASVMSVALDGDTRLLLRSDASAEALRGDAEALEARTRAFCAAMGLLGQAAAVFAQLAGALAGRPRSWLWLGAAALRGLGQLGALGLGSAGGPGEPAPGLG